MQNKGLKIVSPPQDSIVWVFVILAGLILPALLIPLVKFIGYTEVVEEVAKASAVLFLIFKLSSTRAKIFAGVVLGFSFGLSESMFYLTNFFQLGDFSIFWQRFLWTIPMHITTVLIMVFAGMLKGYLLIFGLAGAIALHILFNSVIVDMLI